MSNDQPTVTSRSLSSFSLSFDFVQSRIPSNPEIFDLVALTGAFLESQLDMMYPGITVLLTIANTNFRLMQPFEVMLDIEVENIPSPPASAAELDAAVEMIFQEQTSLEAFLSVIENLPATNIFQSTSVVTFVGPSVSVSSRSKNVVGVSAAAGVLAVLLLIGGGFRQWGKKNPLSGRSPKNYEGINSGSITVTGETCGVTTVATTSKQTRFAFDEAMSFTSRSDWMYHRGEHLTPGGNDEEEIDFSGIRPLFSDANAEDDAEKRVDLLARTDNEPQPNTSNDFVGDDLTVDSYVPLRVVDLIKHFSPGGR